MKKPLAVVTMVYNEPEFLPVWRRHYGRQAGEAQCYVVDHGSTDGSTWLLGGMNRVRIPRSPQDDTRRTDFLSEFCGSLLQWYDAVIYVDVDELLVADPLRFPDLISYARAMEPGSVSTAAGFDVIHNPDSELPIDWGRPVSLQRRFLRFTSSMCKPVLIRRPVRWAPGFHCIDAVPSFDDLRLFHLRYADLDSGLERLARTRVQPWAYQEAGQHQRMPDRDWEGMLRSMSGLPVQEGGSLEARDPLLREWTDKVIASSLLRAGELYRFDLHISGDHLWPLPERFVGSF
ncbi:glycosyltransferase family 2 protein [Acetobacter sp. AN02]|uniref:glycosyltransferase family 2 protein n=1 Tax=Acetobacter sp. AN02 TaxID=2894186 RepID=UPI0024343642|nr:glycosyltransferase family 2 protein [Acetobacter sp. AN02]MDG6093781.1 glycosyltransferase family 2 protein [Acetobacter sp. AN02]